MRCLFNLHFGFSIKNPLRSIRRNGCIVFGMSLIMCSFNLVGCGGEEPQYSTQRGIPTHLRRKKGSSGKSKGQKKNTVSQGQRGDSVRIPDRLKRKELFSSMGWRSTQKIRADLDQLRDPFTPNMPEMKKQEEVKIDPESVQQKLEVAVKVDFRNLAFTGALTGIAVNQALLEDSSGRGYTVRVGDIVGQSPDYVRVASITSNQIRYEWVSRGNESSQLPPLRYYLRSEDSIFESSQVTP